MGSTRTKLGIQSPQRCNEHLPQLPTVKAHLSRRGMLQNILLTATLSAVVLPGVARAQEPLVDLTGGQKAALEKAFQKLVTKSRAALLLRLAFHDAATYRMTDHSGGPNGSLQFELDRAENAGLKRGWNKVEEARKLLRGSEAGVLSDADLIALLGAHSIKVCKGPDIRLQVGRKDVSTPDPLGRLPDENASILELKSCFADAGINTKEFVCLSGAHTLGTKGFGDPVNFDNFYFQALLRKPWLDKSDPMASMIGLPSDRVLVDDEECRLYITQYAENEQLFFSDFSKAYEKMTTLGYL